MKERLERSIPSLVGDALSQFAKLFQNEVDLAKAELGEKAQHVGKALTMFGAGAILLIPAVVLLLLALAAALIERGWSDPLAYLFSAVVAALVAGALFMIGMRQLSAEQLKPSQTLGQIEKDKEAVKGFVR